MSPASHMCIPLHAQLRASTFYLKPAVLGLCQGVGKIVNGNRRSFVRQLNVYLNVTDKTDKTDRIEIRPIGGEIQ